jgi:hypothetical protein
MKSNKLLSAKNIIGFVVLCSSMVGFDSPAQETASGSVVFVTGGIGEEQEEGLRAIANQYNLKLAFAAKGTGEYVGDVNVKVRDSKGHTVLETKAAAPCLFAKVPPGNYRVLADFQGKTVDKTIKAGSPKNPGVNLLWDVSAEPREKLSKEEMEVSVGGGKKLPRGKHGCW